MSEAPTESSGDFQHKPPDGEFTIKKLYCKDISFETPSSPDVFRLQWKPEAEMHLSTEAKSLGPGEYEVVLMVTVTVNLGGKTAFLAEVKYAGIFGISGLTTDELGRTLGCYCPGILFPYGREVVSDLVTRGGFPQFILSPVNFEALYRKHLAEQTQSQTPAGKPPL